MYYMETKIIIILIIGIVACLCISSSVIGGVYIYQTEGDVVESEGGVTADEVPDEVPEIESEGGVTADEVPDEVPDEVILKSKFTLENPTQTVLEDSGNGNAVFLDRHNIDCENNAINRMKLNITSDGKQMKYDFTCSGGDGGFSNFTNNATTPSDIGGGNTVLLDRHTIDCGKDGVIKQMRLNNLGDNTIQYEYNCLKSDKPLTCTDHNTNYDLDGNGRSEYLDRHDIKCPSDKVLSKLKLTRNGDKYRYDYTCCGY